MKNQAEESPYEGDAGVFGVTDQDREVARKGQNAEQAAKSGPMTVVAAAGIGTGSALVLGLGVWTLLARRRAAAAGHPGGGGHQPLGCRAGSRTPHGASVGGTGRQTWVRAQIPTAKQISATTSTGTATFAGGPGRIPRTGVEGAACCTGGAGTGGNCWCWAV